MLKPRPMKIAFVACVSIFFIFTLLFAGCTPAAKSTTDEPAEVPEKITIGFALWTMEYTFFQRIEKGVRDAAEDLGFEYIMLDQNSDATKMIEDINTLVGMKVDAIVITPVDPGAIGPAVENARNAGIPVVCADIGYSGPVNALIVSDNFNGGELAAEYLHSLLADNPDNSWKFGIGNLSPEWTYARERGEGFRSKAEELGYEIATELIANEPTAEVGFDIMAQMISAAPDIVGAFYASGPESVGAARAVEAMGDDILVIGYDGAPEELLAIRDGILAATILQLPYDIGYKSVEILKEILIDGAEYEEEIIGAPVSLVTADNLEEIAAKLEKDTGISAWE